MDDIDLNQRVFEEEESIYEDIQISPKRKSGDRFDENDENIQLNNAQENNNIKGEDVNLIKKIKFSTSDVSSSAVSNKKPAIVKRAVQIPSAPITKPVRIGSSLPRYNQVPVKKATSIPIKSAVATPIVTVNIGTKSNEMIASPEKTSSNENKMIASEAIMSATRVGCNGLMKRLKDVVVSHSSEGVVKGFFEKTFTSTEESFTSKLVVRTKNKWDIKEKVKKQEAAFIEVREMLVNHFQELAIIRNTCLTHDERVNALLSDTLDALQNKDTQIDELAASKITLSSDHTHMSERLREVEFKLKIASEEVEPCKMELSRLKEKLVEEEVKSQLLNTRVTELVTQHASLEIENKDLLLAQQSASFAQKDVHEKMVSKYESEIISLQNKLQSLEAQIERLLFEKNDLESSRVQMEESQLRLTNQLQEKTNLSDKLNMEVHELTEQSKQLRNQLQEATNELLSVTESSQECQRMAEEEKNVLKLELTNLAGNLAMMEKENTSLTAQLAASENNATSQSRDLIQAKSQITVLDAKLQVAQEEVLASRLAVTQLAVEKELRARAEVREDAERRERVAATAQAMALEGECSMRIKAVEEQARTAVETLNQQISQLQKEKEDTLKDLHESIEMITGLDNEVKSLKQSIDHASVSQEAHAVKELSRVTGELEIMRRRVKELSETQETHVVVEAKKIAEYEERLLASEKQRRKLHNLVQELRGNIRVFARVRPFLPSDGGHERGVTSKTIMPNAETNSVRIQRVDECRTEDQVFQFDKVFGPSFNQEGVFQEVSEFVQSALDGYHVCLFAYGMTGSGKTHTMQGCGTGAMRGIIPRAMEQVGMYKTELEAKGWQYSMNVTFVEIYNETIRDLLRSGGDFDSKHEIKKDVNNCVFVSDVTTLDVDPNNTEQLNDIMLLAQQHRSVGQTSMNETSSRSHSIFTLHLKATNEAQGVVLKGTLSLVDLAGSERVDRSGVTGTAFKETVAINKSLSALTDVFTAIANKQPHIPFRNSKLTYLLQPALSGDGKTLMIVNLSPTEESYHESLCSLRLAKQVNQCELGKPKKQVKETSHLAPAQAASSSTSFSAATNSSTVTAPTRKPGIPVIKK